VISFRGGSEGLKGHNVGKGVERNTFKGCPAFSGEEMGRSFTGTSSSRRKAKSDAAQHLGGKVTKCSAAHRVLERWDVNYMGSPTKGNGQSKKDLKGKKRRRLRS